MKRSAIFGAVLACVFALGAYGAAQGNDALPQTKPKAIAAKGNGAEGEQRFQTHCGRCHNPPEELSAREARTVVRQMRVRAMLSAEMLHDAAKLGGRFHDEAAFDVRGMLAEECAHFELEGG